MIKTKLTGRGYDIDSKLQSYIEDKLSGLDKYIPRAARKTAHLEVVLIDDPSGREDNRYVCEAIIKLPSSSLQSCEGAVKLYASVDIVSRPSFAPRFALIKTSTPRSRGGRGFSLV